MKELQRANDIMTKIIDKELSWDGLFKKLDFLNEYRFYLKIDVLTKKVDDQKFLGYIESKLKKLILEFEKYDEWAAYSDSEVPEVLIHPWMVTYKLSDDYFSSWNTFLFGIDLKSRKSLNESSNSSEIDELLENEGIHIEEIDYSNFEINDIIESFYSTLLTEEIFIVYGFPHEANLKFSVVGNEEIAEILNPSISDSKSKQKTIDKEIQLDIGLSYNTFWGSKRPRDNLYHTYYQPPKKMEVSKYKRAKCFE